DLPRSCLRCLRLADGRGRIGSLSSVPPPPPPPLVHTLSLHDALPIYFLHHRLDIRTSQGTSRSLPLKPQSVADFYREVMSALGQDRESTRLNCSHGSISYAVFCLGNKKVHCPSVASYSRCLPTLLQES